MNRRVKQIVYGLFYLLIWGSLGYGIYRATLKPPASCVDNIRNQEEVETDCGGPYCQDCAIKRLLPIKITSVSVVPAGTADTATALVGFQNQNSTYGAMSFKYRLEFFTAAAVPAHIEEGEAFMYPSEIKYRALVNLPMRASDIVRHTETISATVWTAGADLSVPKTQLRTVRLATDDAGRAIITGILRNNSDFPILTATIHGYITDAVTKVVVAASKTTVQDLAPTEERFFQILVPTAPTVDLEALRANVSVEARR